MANYRTPSAKEAKKLQAARELMQSGIAGESDFLSKLMPTMAKSARDDIRTAKAVRESVPKEAREGEAYNQAGYAKGGKVKAYVKGGGVDGCAQRGKTRGKVI